MSVTIGSDLAGYLNRRRVLRGMIGLRLFPDQAPQDSKRPFVVYQLESSDRPRHLKGSAGLVNATYQFDIYASTRGQARQVAEEIRTSLDGLGTPAEGETEIRSVAMLGWRDDVFPPQDGSDQGIYNASVEFSIWYRERVPGFPAA